MHKKITYTELKTAMLLYMPFFASLLLDRMQVKIGKFEILAPLNTAGTDGKTIWLDKDFFESMKLPEAVFLVCHEIAHAMWMHMDRGKRYKDMGKGPDGVKDFSPMCWNYATDYIINAMLLEAKVGSMPKGGLRDARFDGSMLADEVYKVLIKEPPPSGGSGSGVPGVGGNAGDEGTDGPGRMDKHILDVDGTSKAEWKRAIKSAADAAKAVGKLPGSLSRFVDNLLNPVVPWQEKLRFSLTKVISRESHTWAKLHRRRYVSQGLVFPGYTGFGAGIVVVAIDTSGSIGIPELTRFASELDGILSDANPSELWVLGCDAAIHDVTKLERGDSIKDNPPALKGGGGTSFIPPFEWVDENGINAAALVYLTDMMGPFPDHPAKFPVIWCSTSKGIQAPWGETIEIPVEAQDGEI